MSTRWRLAQLVKKRIQSIMKDSGQLRGEVGREAPGAIAEMRYHLIQAEHWAETIEGILKQKGEAEDD